MTVSELAILVGPDPGMVLSEQGGGFGGFWPQGYTLEIRDPETGEWTRLGDINERTRWEIEDPSTAISRTGRIEVRVTGGEGQELELQLPGDEVLSTCDQQGPESPFDGPAYFVFSGKDAGWYAQGPDNRWQLFIVDVEGTRLITLLSYFDDVPQADVEAARAIVESFEFTP